MRVIRASGDWRVMGSAGRGMGGGGGGHLPKFFLHMLHKSVALSRNIFGTAALLTASIMSD